MLGKLMICFWIIALESAWSVRFGSVAENDSPTMATIAPRPQEAATSNGLLLT